MRDILIILGSFAAGLLLALFGVIPDTLDISQISKYVLYLLMFLVGVNLGKDEQTLKLIRNQLRNMMTSSDIGTTVFRNLDAIGICVDAASANNIDTNNIINLSFDKDKFLEAYEADDEAVKALLVGSENNTGIFNKVEQLLESALTSVSGYFDSADRSFDREIERLDNKIVNATKDMQRYRERLENKFSAMDMLIANMQQQYASFLV